MPQPMKKSDPAYWLLEEGRSGKRKIKKPEVYKPGCYICDDPEYALMGLPLCRACPICGAHVAADDYICENGHDEMEWYMKQDEKIGETEIVLDDGPCNLTQFDDVSLDKKPIGDKIMEEMIQEKKDDLDDFLKMIGWA